MGKNFDLTQTWRYNTILHEPKKREMGLLCLVKGHFWIIWRYHSVSMFTFCLETTVSETIGWERPCCYGNFFPKVSFRKYLITAMFKVLYQQLQGTLTTAFEGHLATEDFTGIDQHRCQTCTKTFDLLMYASLSLNQT